MIQIDQHLLNYRTFRHTKSGLETIWGFAGSWGELAWTEQRLGCGLDLQEGSAEFLSEASHRLDASDEAMELAFLGSVDEPDVVLGTYLQAVEDRRQIIRNAAALAFDDGAAGPVDQFKVVAGVVGDGPFGVSRGGRPSFTL